LAALIINLGVGLAEMVAVSLLFLSSGRHWFGQVGTPAPLLMSDPDVGSD
jgi:hypothetical protein